MKLRIVLILFFLALGFGAVWDAHDTLAAQSIFEIGAGKLAVILSGPSIVGMSGIQRVVKTAKMDVLTVDFYTGAPFSRLLVPLNAFVARTVSYFTLPITGILSVGANPHVGPLAIQSIAVNVVNHITGWRI